MTALRPVCYKSILFLIQKPTIVFSKPFSGRPGIYGRRNHATPGKQNKLLLIYRIKSVDFFLSRIPLLRLFQNLFKQSDAGLFQFKLPCCGYKQDTMLKFY